jgi:hypothetical protein
LQEDVRTKYLLQFSIPSEAPIEKTVQPRADLFLHFGDGRGISYDEGCHNTIDTGEIRIRLTAKKMVVSGYPVKGA